MSRSTRVNEAAALFGESASRVVVSASPDAVAEVLQGAAAAGVPAEGLERRQLLHREP